MPIANANWRLWILESVFWGFWWEFHESGILKERTLTVQLLLEKKAEFSYLCFFFSWSEGQFPRNWSSIFLYLRVKTAQIFLVRSNKLVFYLSEKANFWKQTSNFSFAPSFTRNRQINPQLKFSVLFLEKLKTSYFFSTEKLKEKKYARTGKAQQ